MTTPNRILNPKCLPQTLWDSDKKILRLPNGLARAYETLIDRYGLRDLAMSRTVEDSPIGGLDKPTTDKHFAQQFDNSAARAQLAITNATTDVARVSNALIQTLSGNMVCITDAPCGAGAAAFSLLSTIAELRAHNVLPRVPLHIHFIGAEISEFARQYAKEMLAELTPFLESQAIFVQAEMLPWDVTDCLSNTDLIQNMLRAKTSVSKNLLVVANFSGFLTTSGKQKDAQPQLAELFRHASGDESVVIWIEPQMNLAVSNGGLFSIVGRWVKDKWHRFVRINTDGVSDDHFLTSEVQFQSTLTPARLRPVRLAVMRLDLVRTL
ncbi:MAG TPA: hypothetical protein VMV48_09025 [Gallionellaceae bacterium]|nr:hypothetical protein [Gallionellaceae bacterium]